MCLYCYSIVVVENLIGTSETLYGIYNTVVGNNSSALTLGSDVAGQYSSGVAPSMACDNNLNTKYYCVGTCDGLSTAATCGTNTGFYLTPVGGASVAVGFQFCSANDIPARDPLTITLEGSNQLAAALPLGSTWTLIYSGLSGLATDPGRQNCTSIQYFSNAVPYTSYRLVIVSIRGAATATQYSEFQLTGYCKIYFRNVFCHVIKCIV